MNMNDGIPMAFEPVDLPKPRIGDSPAAFANRVMDLFYQGKLRAVNRFDSLSYGQGIEAELFDGRKLKVWFAGGLYHTPWTIAGIEKWIDDEP